MQSNKDCFENALLQLEIGLEPKEGLALWVDAGAGWASRPVTLAAWLCKNSWKTVLLFSTLVSGPGRWALTVVIECLRTLPPLQCLSTLPFAHPQNILESHGDACGSFLKMFRHFTFYQFFTEASLIYSVVFISAVQQSDWVLCIYTHTFFFNIFFSIMVCHRILHVVVFAPQILRLLYVHPCIWI